MTVNDLILDKLNLLQSKRKNLWIQIDKLQDIIGLDINEYEQLVKMQNQYIKLGYQVDILLEILNDIQTEESS